MPDVTGAAVLTHGAVDAAVVTMTGISRRFRGVQAVRDVDLTLRAGEVLGLAGENGSGKSTLVRMLAGVLPPDTGAISLDGRAVRWRSPADALAAGVGLVAQEVLVQPALSVAENLLFGRMPRRFGRIDWAATHTAAAGILAEFGVDTAPDIAMGRLPLQQQQMVAIAKLTHRAPRVLLLDEPTSSLSAEQVEVVYRAIRRLRERGSSIVFITHRLREYFDVCDRLLVLRDGNVVAQRAASETDEHELVRLMVGRELSSIFVRPPVGSKPSTLDGQGTGVRLDGIGTRRLSGVSLDIAPGEIVGVAGQAGSGRSSLARVLFGQERYTGRITVDGREVRLRSARDAIRAGIAYVPEDRKAQGLVLTCSVHENITIASWERLSRWGVSARGAEAALTEATIRRLGIRTPSPSTRVSSLSGGNQQKVVIGKWVARTPRLLVLDEPTRGVDVGAKDEIYRLIDELAAGGTSVLVISSELLELMRLADRIVVLAGGRVAGVEAGADATEESLTRLAFRRPQQGGPA